MFNITQDILPAPTKEVKSKGNELNNYILQINRLVRPKLEYAVQAWATGTRGQRPSIPR